MLKKATAGVMIAALLVTGAACSKANDSSATSSPQSTQAAAKDNQGKVNNKAYLDARLAEEKVNTLFHEKKVDNNPVLNPAYGDKQRAVDSLGKYYDTALANQIVDHYLTDQKQGEAIVVKTDKFFQPSIIENKKEDIKFDDKSNADEVTFTTKDNLTYVMKKKGDTFIVMNVEKK
ncbi:hypothetical protein ABNC15_12300 [Paenibacillus larvae]